MFFKNAGFGLIAAAVLLSGCATKGSWMGADAEKKYDTELAATRLAESRNNDDYYEIHQDGRIYVLADLKTYQAWLKTGEIPKMVTKIGAGPKGETLKIALTSNESKAMETKVGFKGGAENLYDNKVDGLEKGFFGFVLLDSDYVVFSNWKQLDAYRKSGSVPAGAEKLAGSGPNGANVVYVGKTDDMVAKFKSANNL